MSTPQPTTPRDPSDSFASLFERTAGARRAERRYSNGEQLDVTIVAIARDAVFADLGGKQEGVFERIDLVDSEGKLRVELGSVVFAVVRGTDAATGQVRLAPVVIRGTEAEPAGRAVQSAAAGATGPLLVEGTRVKGSVTGVERYGVFVQIAGTKGRSGRGLIPTSETGTPRGSDLKRHFEIGKELEAKIMNIGEDGRIRLSITALAADDERGLFEAFKKGEQPEETADAASEGQGSAKGAAAQKRDKKPEPRNFGTLGDLLGKVAPKAAPTPAASKAAPARAALPATAAAPTSTSPVSPTPARGPRRDVVQGGGAPKRR